VRGRSGPVFIGYHGQRLAGGTAREAMSRLDRRAGLARHIHPHLLRHTYATDLLRAGCDIYAPKELLGHATLKSTEVYLHATSDELKECYRAASQRKESGKSE